MQALHSVRHVSNGLLLELQLLTRPFRSGACRTAASVWGASLEWGASIAPYCGADQLLDATHKQARAEGKQEAGVTRSHLHIAYEVSCRQAGCPLQQLSGSPPVVYPFVIPKALSVVCETCSPCTCTAAEIWHQLPCACEDTAAYQARMCWSSAPKAPAELASVHFVPAHALREHPALKCTHAELQAVRTLASIETAMLRLPPQLSPLMASLLPSPPIGQGVSFSLAQADAGFCDAP